MDNEKLIMDNENKLVPKLCFPEFQNEEWVTAVLKDVCEVNPTSQDLPEKFIYVDLESVVEGQLIKEKIINKKDAPSRAQRVLEKGDILFQMVRPYQKNNLFFNKNGSYVASTGYAQIRTKLHALFFYYLFHTDYFVGEVLKKCTGSNYPAINSSDFSNLIIHYPLSIIHSKKIASCLSSLDELLSAEVAQLEALKVHKKGLMQNLFPSMDNGELIMDNENKLVPKLRFPEFQNEEWVTAKLGDIVSFSKGKGISKDDIVSNGTVECIRYGELYTTYGEVIKEIVSKTNLDKKDLILSEINDVIIPSSGETQEDIAKASCVLKEGVAIGGDVNILKTKLDGVFLSYYLNSAKKKEIANMAQGVSVMHLYASQLKNLIIHYPLSIIHSKKIASCLSSLDELIGLQGEKIDLLKEHKKGLMQGLFPNLNQ